MCFHLINQTNLPTSPSSLFSNSLTSVAEGAVDAAAFTNISAALVTGASEAAFTSSKQKEYSSSVEKKLENRTRKRVYGFHSWLKLQPCLLIGGDHWMWKGGNYLTA